MTTTRVAGVDVKVADGGTTVLVRSKSNPKAFWTVAGGRCGCKGFAYRGVCRHVELAVVVLGEREATQQPQPARIADEREELRRRAEQAIRDLFPD